MDRRKFMLTAPAAALPTAHSITPEYDQAEPLRVFRALSPEDQMLVLTIAQRLTGASYYKGQAPHRRGDWADQQRALVRRRSKRQLMNSDARGKTGRPIRQ